MLVGSLLLFDIDGTVFNTEKFGSFVRTEFLKILTISKEELSRAIADYFAALETTTDFSPRDITIHIGQRYSMDPILLDKVFWENDKIYKDSLYPEVVSVLKKLSEIHTLGIFSQGNEEFQTRKLRAAGIMDIFNKGYIFIYARKLLDEAISNLPRNAAVIDNKHDVVVELSKSRDTIWINRKSDESDPHIKTIHALTEILDIRD